MEGKSLLTVADVAKMRRDLEENPPQTVPPKGREHWDVWRIVLTLEGLEFERDDAEKWARQHSLEIDEITNGRKQD